MTEKEKKISLQTITIANPHNPVKQAVLNIWFVDDDIVIGGINWFEYYEYKKLNKTKGTQTP